MSLMNKAKKAAAAQKQAAALEGDIDKAKANYNELLRLSGGASGMGTVLESNLRLAEARINDLQAKARRGR